MWVTEHASKLLLSDAGVAVPAGTACSRDQALGQASAIGFPLYVKALLPMKNRVAAGAVQRVTDGQELIQALERMRTLRVDEVRLEREVLGSATWYVAVGWFPPDECPQALFSAAGGSGIEQRSAAIVRVAIDPEIGPLPYHTRLLARGHTLEPSAQRALLDVLRACFKLLWTHDALLVELNPVVLCDGEPVAVDARVIVDDSSRVPDRDTRVAHERIRSPRGVLGELATRGIACVPLGGDVGVAGLGAGMTMHLVDWVALEGASPAFFFDATEAAVRDWRAMFAGEVPVDFANALGYGLRRMLPSAKTLLVNFTSGGTPVDALVRGLLHAWGAGIGWDGSLVVHAAGNSGEAARQLLVAAGVDAPATVGAAVRRAAELARVQVKLGDGMSILLDKGTRVCVQGITGVGGTRHARSMVGYGTTVVAGVSPGHGGETLAGVPVFETCDDAVDATGAELSVCFVGGEYVLDAVCEAADAGIKSVVCIEEFVPLKDIVLAKRYCAARGCRLIGPNCNGILSPEKAKVGFFPDELSLPGSVGIASRSGSLTYGAMLSLHARGLGQSTVVGIGGAAIKGTSFVDCLELFRGDTETEVVALLGEIGGHDEEQAAVYITQTGYEKPVAALVVGRVAPPGVTMGHAGAVIEPEGGGFAEKVDALRQAGVAVAATLDELAAMVATRLGGVLR